MSLSSESGMHFFWLMTTDVPIYSHWYSQIPYIIICVYPLAMAQRSESRVKFHLNSAKSASHLKAKFYNGRLKPSLTHWLSSRHIPANPNHHPLAGNHTFHNFQLSTVIINYHLPGGCQGVWIWTIVRVEYRNSLKIKRELLIMNCQLLSCQGVNEKSFI